MNDQNDRGEQHIIYIMLSSGVLPYPTLPPTPFFSVKYFPYPLCPPIF